MNTESNVEIRYIFPNQKIMTIDKVKDTEGRSSLYSKVNIEADEKAREMLKPATYKVYCYLNRNMDNYTFALSSKAAMKSCCISINTYHAAIKELIKYGYITSDDEHQYRFHEDSVTRYW